jgi:hypothetical protein
MMISLTMKKRMNMANLDSIVGFFYRKDKEMLLKLSLLNLQLAEVIR